MYLAKTVFALIITLILSASIPPPVFAAVTRGLRGPKAKTIASGGLSLSSTIDEYIFAGSEQREATQSYGLKVGYDILGESFANNIGIEGSLNYFSTRSKTDASGATGYLFRLDAIYPLILGEKWMPFLAVGGGRIVIDSVSNADRSPLFNYGAGLKYFLEEYLAVRVDARQIVVYDNATTRNNYEVGIGMSYYFGKERKKIPVQPEKPKPLELPSDNLEPLPALEPAVKPLLKDGAEDKSVPREGSPTKPFEANKSASEAGRSVGQTVGEKAVKSADSTKASEMNNQRAAAEAESSMRPTVGEKVIKKLMVNFDFDSSYVKPQYFDKLMEIADTLKRTADTSARIEGHSDSTGKLKYNMKLSEQRAKNVKNSLMRYGVDPGLLSIASFGPLRPMVDNAVPAGRVKNRRVETLVTLKEREPKIKVEQEDPEQIKLEAERREKKRVQAEKLARAGTMAVIMLQEGKEPVPVGSKGSLPIEISNKGKNSEEFLVTITADKEFEAILTRVDKPDENITRLHLAAGDTFKGAVVFRMPVQKADGHRSVIMVKAESARFSDVSFQKEAVVISSAPYVRAVAKLAKQKVTPGEKLRYHVTVLNAGSLPVRNLTVRLQLPSQVDFLGAPDVSSRLEPNGTLVFRIDQVETGKLAEINLDVKVREDSTAGQELRGQVEVVYGNTQRKDVFTTNSSIVVAK